MGEENLDEVAPRSCPNCRSLLVGEYCHQCGQKKDLRLRNAFKIFFEGFSEMFEYDSRVRQTFFPLMFKPGFLSSDWVAGRRARYVQPVRLYLFISVVFFIAFSIVTDADTEAIRSAFNVDIGEENAQREPPTVDIPWLAPETNDEFADKLLALQERPEVFVNQARQLAPQMMFVLLPLFALLLRILYPFAKRYYVEHLILAVHTHTFLFLSFTLLIALAGVRGWAAEQVAASWVGIPAGWLTVALWIWIPIYLLLAQKHFYRQGWFMTVFKYLLTGFLYFMMLSFALAGLMIAALMTA